MNERIDQLWAQALDLAVPETYTQLSHSQVLKIKQVFADMIVRECAQIGEDVDGNQTTKNEILKHFGVEE